METTVTPMMQAMVIVMQTVPLGTNVGLIRILWVMLNGSFLRSRGAVIPALQMSGFSVQEIRRSWAALRYGAWEINELLENWQGYVRSQNKWRERRYERYRVFSIDMTGFWRPRLEGWLGKLFNSMAQKALPAVVFGLMIVSGEIGSQRVPLLVQIVRCDPKQSKAAFRQQFLKAAAKQAALDDVIVMDAEFEIAEIQSSGVVRYVVRMASNATARRNFLPPYKGKGPHPRYGEKVRPRSRCRKEKTLSATPPDHESTFDYQGRRIQVAFWQNLVLSDTMPATDAKTFSLYLYYDPAYTHPLLLATDLKLLPQTPYLIYRDRWPVEQPPLAAKQMIGLHRNFVFALDSCFRLPELALFASNILTYFAATFPPTPTGFWDRSPKSTPGRLRRLLAKAAFPNLEQFDPLFRKKNSVSEHLPKGTLAHRRKPSPKTNPISDLLPDPSQAHHPEPAPT